MTLKQRVEELLQEALKVRKDLFIIELNISSDNKINVIIDGDKGITLNDCIEISRSIEHPLNEDEFDFSLEVMSPGATEPLIDKRQYNKNIGRTLEVKTVDGSKFEGVLSLANDERFQLVWKERQPKPIGKGKVTVTLEKMLSFSEVKESKVKIKFN
ncbi:ribosome assembly cofactor RimP [Ascidiimonas sp. W6]|uniref:ribosome assembly cofactor RimP n=1 Tax=Ascidiimonas meishanensis TaxID=3128903 RepID=UPI0030EF61A9